MGALVREFAASGMSAAEFARRAGVSAQTLGRWRKACREKPRQLIEVTLGGAEEVGAPAVGSGGAIYAVEFSNVRVEIPGAFDAAAVRSLLRMVREEVGRC
jgi:transcriptional regulator with XRE-family HTH domain